MVDLSQVKMYDSMDVGEGQGVSSSSAVKRSPTCDPPTRNLEAAIEKAILTSDFNDLSYALLQGASPNHQRPRPRDRRQRTARLRNFRPKRGDPGRS